MQENVQLSGIIEEIQSGHGNPTKEEIVASLCKLSASLQCHNWRLLREGGVYLARFSSPAGLKVALC